jgi:hypothetical protein
MQPNSDTKERHDKRYEKRRERIYRCAVTDNRYFFEECGGSTARGQFADPTERAKYHLHKGFTKLGISSRSQLDRVLPSEPATGQPPQ